MHFTFTQGTGQTGVIRGVDSRGVEGEQVVYTGDWAQYQKAVRCTNKGNEMDEAIREFFEPLFEKLEEGCCNEQADDPLDPVRVIREEVKPTKGTPGVSINLGHDGTLILAVVEGHWDRLSWVNGQLFVGSLTQPTANLDTPF